MTSTPCRHVRASRPAPRESPAQPLRADLECWLAGGSYWGDWRQIHAALLSRLEGPISAGAATDVLEAGLRQRVPAWPEWGVILRLDDGEWATYQALVAHGADRRLVGLGGEAPAGVGVCKDCRGVFRPSRRVWANKCPRCQGSPRPRTVHAPGRTSFAVDAIDPAGEAVGWRVRHVRVCEVCRARFEPARADARYCSGRCRVAAHRERSRVA